MIPSGRGWARAAIVGLALAQYHVDSLDAAVGSGGRAVLAAQAGRAATLLRLGTLPAGTREFVRKSLEDEADWQRELTEARLASHMYLGPTWFMYDPSGWSFLGWYPYGMPRP